MDGTDLLQFLLFIVMFVTVVVEVRLFENWKGGSD